VWSNPIHRSESIFVEFLLEAHVSYGENVILVRLSSLDTEVKPRVEVTYSCVWQAVATHVKIETVGLFSKPLDVVHAAGIELARNGDSVGKSKLVLLRINMKQTRWLVCCRFYFVVLIHAAVVIAH
jgi:hypothetical protein